LTKKPDLPAGEAWKLGGIAELVFRSNLLGSDRSIANQGGGNTSMKSEVEDHAGRPTRVLWVKGSGRDLATIDESGFAEFRLDDLLLLKDRSKMSDEAMVAYIERTSLAPGRPRGSVETLLHAFLPAVHIDHTHPDSVIALSATPSGENLARETFGDEALWVPWQRPGFALAKSIAAALEDRPQMRAVVLERHGLITWGQTGEEAYGSTIEFVGRATETLENLSKGKSFLGGQRITPVSNDEAAALLRESLPALRGALLGHPSGVILEVDRGDQAVAFSSSQRGPDVSQIGSPCPDHLINTKHKPLAIRFDPTHESADDLSAKLRNGVASYAQWYERYYAENMTDESREFSMDSPGPRVVLVPGVGIVTAGKDAARARFSRDLYRRAIEVESAADAAGGFRSLDESAAFQIEYWPLERYKLAQALPDRELTGKVALVTGGASGIGRATALRLAELGGHVGVADLNLAAAQEVADEITRQFGERTALPIAVDVRSEEAVLRMAEEVVLEWGGLDILVCSAGIATAAPVTDTTVAEWDRNHEILARGYFLAAREAFRIMIAQASGGSIVFIGSKNALVGGTNAAAYSSAKAASLHLARVLADEGGPHGIRVNTVNPDAVLQGSGIWTSEWRAARAHAYDVAQDDLPDFYRKRSVLGLSIYAEDVAEAVAFLAGPRSSKSTGNIFNVDGGVSAAYTR
jgi:rhamnulose-1-phosphate aldolase/alcohol dehydrogenase